jgi:hypothetical protein
MDITISEYSTQLEAYKANLKSIEDQAEQARITKKYRISGKLMKEYWAEHAKMCAFIKEHPTQDRVYQQEQMEKAVARIWSNNSYAHIFQHKEGE